MQLQEKDYSCGPAALRAALYRYGKKHTEKVIRRWAQTTPDGTDEEGLMRAIAHYKLRYKVIETYSVRDALNKLKYYMSRGIPLLLSVDNESHWFAAVGAMGKDIMVFDPEPSWKGCRPKYSGVRYFDPTTLASRWMATTGESAGVYYAIAVLPPKP